jgi:hypothetical protein
LLEHANHDLMVVVPPPGGEAGGDATIGVSGAVIALAVVFVALRFYTRIFTHAGLGADDWFIFAAVITTLATAAILLAGKIDAARRLRGDVGGREVRG